MKRNTLGRRAALSILVGALGVGALGSACKGDSGPNGNGNGNGGITLSGKVTDSRGGPVKGAQVVLDSSQFLDGAGVLSEADGTYEMPLEPGTWRAVAQLKKEYRGQTYALDLTSDNNAPFNGNQSVVRNFTWKLTGERDPNSSSSGYYGGRVMVRFNPNVGLYDTENIEVTMQPDGPLIDGSTGSTLVLKPGNKPNVGNDTIQDIPMGHYVFSARYLPTGEAPQALQISNETDDVYGPTTSIDFDTGRRTVYLVVKP